MMILLFISHFFISKGVSGEGKHVSNKCFWGETRAVKMKFWRKVWFHCSTLISRNSFLHDLLLSSSLFINKECSYRSIKMTVWVVFHLRDKRNEQKSEPGRWRTRRRQRAWGGERNSLAQNENVRTCGICHFFFFSFSLSCLHHQIFILSRWSISRRFKANETETRTFV